MTTLETLLLDPDMGGDWNLVPDRSAITFKIRNMWGLLRVKGRFTEFSGDGQLTGNLGGRSTAASTSARRRCAPVSAAATSTCARRTSSMSSATPRSASSSPLCSRPPATPPSCGPASPSKATNEPVPLPVRVAELNDGSVRISGETKVDRAQFGLGWNKLGVMSATATIAADTIFVRAPQ